MFSSENFLHLPLIRLILLTVVINVYVILDGFDPGGKAFHEYEEAY